MSLAEKIFGTFSDRELKKINPITKKVLALEPKYQALSDADLQAQTPALKARLAGGETLFDYRDYRAEFERCCHALAVHPVILGAVVVLHRGMSCRIGHGRGALSVLSLSRWTLRRKTASRLRRSWSL